VCCACRQQNSRNMWWQVLHAAHACVVLSSGQAPSCHSETKGWGPLRLCLLIICICTSVDSDSQYSTCRSHHMLVLTTPAVHCAYVCCISAAACALCGPCSGWVRCATLRICCQQAEHAKDVWCGLLRAITQERTFPIRGRDQGLQAAAVSKGLSRAAVAASCRFM
jgi:hypothetical protein